MAHQARKTQILDRAKKIGNQKVLKLLQDDFLAKLDQAGPMAGIWLEKLEHDWDKVIKKPEGLMKGLKKDDFEDLFKSLYGYTR